jgi:hypothetical protein
MNDLRLAIRTLWATPIVSFVAILSLTLGIGANTAIFRGRQFLLRALPVKEPRQLVQLVEASADGQRSGRIRFGIRSTSGRSFRASVRMVEQSFQSRSRRRNRVRRWDLGERAMFETLGVAAILADVYRSRRQARRRP